MTAKIIPEACALVLGGYVNGYGIIKSLRERGVRNIVLMDARTRPARFSRRISGYASFHPSPEGLLAAILPLRKRHGRVVAFPTDDSHLKWLHEIHDEISPFCFLPFKKDNLLKSMNKYGQYKACQKMGIPHPKTSYIEKTSDIDAIGETGFPSLIKPVRRAMPGEVIFRSLTVNNSSELSSAAGRIKACLAAGVPVIASEIISGSAVFAYTGYRSRDGKILGEWTGRKLAQYPDDFGVFSSSSPEAPDIIAEYGRRLLEGMDLTGINEPEFIYDRRDDSYKLTEINLRSMMWHRTGAISGVNLPYIQYLDATEGGIMEAVQEKKTKIHFVFLKHEVLNLVNRKHYLRTFLYNVFGGKKTYFALFDIKDPGPFIFDLAGTAVYYAKRILNKSGRPFRRKKSNARNA